MKLLLVSLFYISSFSSFADVGIYIPPCSLVSSEVDESLAKDMSLFEFELTGLTDNDFKLRYSVDGQNSSKMMEKGEHLKLTLSPGKHIFQFYVHNYEEINSGELTIEAQHKDHYYLHFTSSVYPTVVTKPVIYLYPEKETQVEVVLNVKGTEPFFYPAYDSKWECTAMPDGAIHIGDKEYNYLFWEANEDAVSIDHREGFLVEKNNVVAFLEEKLTLAGFTSKEQADFITYWGPRMIQHDLSFVRFLFNESCDEFAEIKITPKPTNMYRMYILFQPTEISLVFKEQTIIPMNREGFSVLEWGGMEFPLLRKNVALN
ncbi:MAG: hypothetical protein ACI837_001168 [Crocinitomicaceae bacterium]|jgi:hypothetical protein